MMPATGAESVIDGDDFTAIVCQRIYVGGASLNCNCTVISRFHHRLLCKRCNGRVSPNVPNFALLGKPCHRQTEKKSCVFSSSVIFLR